MSMIDTRREQMFPKLSPGEIDRLRRFGEVRRYAGGEPLFVTGEVCPGMFVLLAGSTAVTRHDPLGHLAPIVEQGPGEFLAEVGQLSGRPALVDAHAVSDVEALLIPPEKLRALMIAETELGDRIMRALILRRVTLIETGVGGPVLIGPASSPDTVRLQGFLARKGTLIRCSIPRMIAMRRRSSSTMLRNSRICRWLCVPTDRFSRIPARSSWHAASGWCASMWQTEPTTSLSSARVRPALRRRSTPHPRACR